MSVTHALFATAPLGVADLLLKELQTLGATDCQLKAAGVQFSASLAVAYRICLWSRLANRVLLHLSTFAADNPDALYQGTREILWQTHLTAHHSLAVDITERAANIGHSHFAALRVKDAIVDSLRQADGTRPNVDLVNPDVRIHVFLDHAMAHISLDLSGGSLHRRGLRRLPGAAPLKENLAAAILARSNWQGLTPLIDPMCGVGTLLIEAAMLVADWAPGLQRQKAGCAGWLQHNASLWQTLYQEAQERKAVGLIVLSKRPPIIGYDINQQCVGHTRDNLATAGLREHVQIAQGDATTIKKPKNCELAGDLFINPPYGERLGDKTNLVLLYSRLGQHLKEEFAGWQAHVLTHEQELGHALGLRANKLHSFYNGALPCTLLHLPIHATQRPTLASGGAMAFANRLQKNLKITQSWLRQQNTNCYRIYDADLPEYAVAIDIYGSKVHIQEYAPPKSIDANRAEARMRDVLLVVCDLLEKQPSDVVHKVRRIQHRKTQYNRHDTTDNLLLVHENGCDYWVNLQDYLDTGLFLDHRNVRSLIAKAASGKRFLNLFGYTATATVAAAKAGAVQTTTVDMSHTYLSWAEHNLRRNGLSSQQNQLIQADCLQWLEKATGVYDVIFLAAPTFSNSKRMSTTLDIQRDHPWLIEQAMRLLAPDGQLYFSSHARQFKLAEPVLTSFCPRNITERTMPHDFRRNPRIHQVWHFTH